MKSLRAFVAVLMFAITGWAHAGALYNGQCYNLTQDAIDAYFSSSEPVITAGSTVYMHQFNRASNQWYSVLSSKTGSGTEWVTVYNKLAPLPTFASCDPLEKFNDALQLSWLAALLLVVGFCAKTVRYQV